MNVTDHEEITRKILSIIFWAEEFNSNPLRYTNFSTEFVESIENFYRKACFITEKQMDALDNIIEKFNINTNSEDDETEHGFDDSLEEFIELNSTLE